MFPKKVEAAADLNAREGEEYPVFKSPLTAPLRPFIPSVDGHDFMRKLLELYMIEDQTGPRKFFSVKVADDFF